MACMLRVDVSMDAINTTASGVPPSSMWAAAALPYIYRHVREVKVLCFRATSPVEESEKLKFKCSSNFSPGHRMVSSGRTRNYYLPRGVITVTVIDITELKGRTELLGRYDPFVKITVGDQTAYTTVQKNAGSEPTWNESFKFPLKSEKNFLNPITFQVFDRNIIKRHSFMGEVSLDLADIPECRTATSWKIPESKSLSLETEEGLGQISFSIGFQEKSAADMLELNMEEQNGNRPKRAESAKKAMRKGRHAAVQTLGAVASVIGIGTFTQVD